MKKSIGCFPARVRFGGAEVRKVSGLAGVATALVIATAVLAGCASGQYTYVTTIGTGERLEFPLERGLPVMVKKGSYEVVHVGLMPSPDPSLKQTVFLFAFTDQTGVAPRSVVVDDVSDREPIRLFEDLEPKLQNNQWRCITRPYDGDDPALHWLGQLGDTMRVFRFTITTADGREVVLHQAWSAPGWMKAAMRRTLGLPAL